MTENKPEKPKGKKIGRRVKLTPDIQAIIVGAVERSSPLCRAADLAGVARSTVYEWIELGENGKGPEYVAFSDALKKACARRTLRLLRVIQDAAPNSWQAAAWLLERTESEHFRRPAMAPQDATTEKQVDRQNINDIARAVAAQFTPEVRDRVVARIEATAPDYAAARRKLLVCQSENDGEVLDVDTTVDEKPE